MAGRLLGHASAPALLREQVGCGLHPGRHKSLAPFWSRTPPREGEGLSEHLIFPVMPATKNTTHLPHVTRKSGDFSPAASSPYAPAQPPPSLSLLPPQPHFGRRRAGECLRQSQQPRRGVPPVSAGIPVSGRPLLQCHCPAGAARAGMGRVVWEQAGGDAVTFPCLFPTLSSWGPSCGSHFYLFFLPLSLSLLLFSLSSLPLPSVCGLITAQTFNSDGNWNNNTGRILLAPLLQLASGSYE